MKILAYTSSAQGHLYPMVPGLRELIGRGHEVTVFCEAARVQEMAGAGINARAVDPAIGEVPVTDFEAANGKERLVRGIGDLMKRGRFEDPDLARAIAETGPDALVVDSFNFGAVTRAEASGIPWAMFTGGLLPLRGKGIPPIGLGLKPMGGPLGRLRDGLIWKVSGSLYGKALLPGLNELRTAAGLDSLGSPFDLPERATRFLVASDRPLEYPRSDLPAFVSFVGPQVWDPPSEIPEWLEAPGDPWVLVTCSTDYQGDEDLALTAAEALAGMPYRVVVTTGDGFEGSPPEPRDNVRFERFVPHGPVLERAAGVICHGGMGIVQKSLSRGIPIVVMPFGRDQPEVARRVTEAGVGVSLSPKKASAGSLREAFTEALKLSQRARTLGEEFRQKADPARFADAVERLA